MIHDQGLATNNRIANLTDHNAPSFTGLQPKMVQFTLPLAYEKADNTRPL